MGSRDPFARWSWVALAGAVLLAAVFLGVTESRYCALAIWTRAASAGVEAASVSPQGDAASLYLVATLSTAGVSFPTAVDRVEFSLTRGGRHLGYLYVFPEDIGVETVLDEDEKDRRRVTVTKSVPGEIARDLFREDLPTEEPGDGAVRLAGSIVLSVSLPRGERVVQIPIAAEVTQRDSK